MTPTDWHDARVILTGGGGFLGNAVQHALRDSGIAADRIFIPRSKDFDLTREVQSERLYAEAFNGEPANVVIHLAAEVGGIVANRDNPARFFFANMAMALHLIEGFRRAGLIEHGSRFVFVGSICAYPREGKIPFREDRLWDGYPEPANAPYGIAKKAAGTMLEAYHAQYGMKAAHLMPINLYGPNDNFDLTNSHVVPALIRKVVEAQDRGDTVLECWGTGSPTREFLHVADAADGIVRAAQSIDDPAPINMGAGRETSIKELAETIAKAAGFEGQLQWDDTKPDGAPRRAVCSERARALLDWNPPTTLEDGLRETVEWFRNNRDNARLNG